MANNTLLASDNFASGSLAAGWSAASGLSVCQVAGTTPKFTEPGAIGATLYGQLWTGLTWPSDQSSEVTVLALTASTNNFLQLRVRYSVAADTGYRAIITNSTAAIYVVTAGTPTQIGSTVSGLTFAAGDIWTLQAAGSCITLYQNGNRVVFGGESTYTSGSPGYCQEAITVLTQNEIASWRGYNAIQQDGIWQKQGIVFAPTNADLATSGLGVFEPCCIYDNNAQLISPDPFGKVYKLWFTVGSVSAAGIYYAEATNLSGPWTRQVAAVIADGATPTVMKAGSTYYIYYQLGSAQGTGATQISTSTDGLTWSASGHTFATGHYPLKPIAIVGGTWYALWGNLLSAGGFGNVELATAPDGLTWTNYASNPVISAVSTYPFPCVAQVGNTWYVWMQKGPSSPQSNAATAKAFDPTECSRWSTTDFIHWTGPVQSLHHSQMFEALNVPINSTEAIGGTAPIAIFNVAGKATMLYGLNQGDAVGPQVVQLSLATAPASIAGIVQFNEDAVQQVATDNFTRANGAIGANWTQVASYGTFKIVSNKAEPNATATDCLMVYTAASFGTSLYSEMTIAALAAADVCTPLIASVVGKFYYATMNQAAAAALGFQGEINYYDGTTIFKLTPLVGITIQVGDVLRLSLVRGTTDVVSLFQNGSLISQGVNLQPQPTSLFPGMYFNEASGGQTQMSLWAGGNANVIPNYPPNNPTRGARSK